MSRVLAAIPGSPGVNLPACQLAPSKAPPSRPPRLTTLGVYSYPAAGQGGVMLDDHKMTAAGG